MWTERIIKAIESAKFLDRPADAYAKLLNSWLKPGPAKDALSGTWLGHAAHPMLVALPIGSWLSVSVLDFTSGRSSAGAARKILAFGTLTAIPTALTGASDWAELAGAERRVGFAHALANATAVGLYAKSWTDRRGDHKSRGRRWALLGAGTIGFSGWLGGHLTYASGVGVDTTAFLSGPKEWTDVAATADLRDGEPLGVKVNEVPLLLLRCGTDMYALNNRCTHRGAPLHEGTVVGDCIQCPWHGSQFKLEDGRVVRGPATRPQPTFEVRAEGGRIQVRSVGEQHALRLNTVGAGNA